MAATRSSAPLSTATPSAGSDAGSSPLARAMASRSPMSSACTSSTAVTTAMVGRAMSHSQAMWPAPRAPISITATSVSSWAFTSVSGTPSSLLKLFSLAVTTWRRAEGRRR